MTKSKKSAGLELVRLCCRALDDKKAEALAVFDVSAQSSITDFMVLATATSEPHLRALRVEVEKVLDGAGSRIVGIEMAQESGWVVVDAFDVMVHLFLAPVREHYSLERLWRDAPELPVAKLLVSRERSKSATPRKKRSVAAKRPTTKKQPARRSSR